MHKLLNSVVAIIIINIILVGALVFQMSRIYIPITYTFESKAEKYDDGYLITLSDVSKFITDNTDTM